MGILDLTKATASLDMADPNLVTFATAGATIPTDQYYLTPIGSSVHLHGSDMTFDGAGHALSGTVSMIELDVGAYDAYRPDLKITGISLAAPGLDDGPDSFWRFMEGNDVIVGPSLTSDIPGFQLTLFGDGNAARAGTSTGGNDIFYAGNAEATIYGDVVEAGSQANGAPEVVYQGGNDEILGEATTEYQSFTGDVRYVRASARLLGGNDSIFIQSTFGIGSAFGDAVYVEGVAGDRAEVVGGNDYLAGGPDYNGSLTGDVGVQLANSSVIGGNDTVNGGESGETISGDNLTVSGGRLTGGADTLRGNGGDDYITGEAIRAEQGARVIAGGDLIYGGAGDDKIFGETGASSQSKVSGGDDLIFGEAGADEISGQTGNDQLFGGADDDQLSGGSGNDFLDGGAGSDDMEGGLGNDVHVVDAAGDAVAELSGQGTDTVYSLLNSYVLGANLEVLVSLASGGFVGIGNGLNNTISSGAGFDAIAGGDGNDQLFAGGGDDMLQGEAGNDLLDGGAGADKMEGGEGFDTMSFASANAAILYDMVDLALNTGDAMGDSHLDIEALLGSSFGDSLRGDYLGNTLNGAEGADTLTGRGGNDSLVGGLGKDILNGGAGNDRFNFLALEEGVDRIVDFSDAGSNDDVLRFDGDVFGGLAEGPLAAGRFVANASGTATTLGQRFVYESDTGVLRFDANGSADGGVSVIATLTGAPALSADDFAIF